MLFFSSTVLSVVSTVLLFAVNVISAPAPSPMVAQENIVFSPHIIYPKAEVSWSRGSSQTVQWETKGLPTQRHDATGLLLIGHFENGHEFLDVEHPVASGFSMKHGSVKIIVPAGLRTGAEYFLVLFGDSGNKSQKFKIN